MNRPVVDVDTPAAEERPNHVPFEKPGPVLVTRTWGHGRTNLGYDPHSAPAIDFDLNTGDAVTAAGNGTVVAAQYDSEGGWFVAIYHATADRTSHYLHLRPNSLRVSAGQSVDVGQTIGEAHNSGSGAQGTHLHYSEVRGRQPHIPAFADRIDPGPMTGCANGNATTYTNWPTRPDTHVTNRGTGCLDGGGGGNNPIGSYDGASNPEHGRVRVFGWAFDPNQQTSPVDIHAYIGGHAGDSGAEGHDLGPADRRRSDLDDIYPGIGDYHGFDETFTTNKEGNQPVCVYAINRGPGTNQFLGCKTVEIRDPDPFGAVDSVASPLGGHVRVGGWAIDPNARTTPVAIHAYVGGRAGEPGAEFHSLGPADLNRPDIEDAYPRSGPYHGFSDVFATQQRGTQEVCIHAINIGPGNNHLLGCRTVSIAALPDRSFSDVEYLHPFYTDIEWMADEGISSGYPDGTYRPSDPVTRAAMSAFMYRLAGEPAFSPGAPSFADTPADHPFFDEIEWMAHEDITSGYSDGGFHPGDTVTRQSMSAFMYRVAGSPSYTPGAPSFGDVPADHPFFKEIEWMSDEGITTGYSNGTYRPALAVSRQAMSAFMHRLADGPGVGV